MPVFLLVFEFLGTTELMVIALVALIIFGPRKLPEIGRMLGKSLGEFKRASDDFKRTWEYEVELDGKKPALPAGQKPHVGSDALTEGVAAVGLDAGEFAGDDLLPRDDGQTIARNANSGAPAAREFDYESEAATDGGETSETRVGQRDDELNAS
ncbi:MAG: twin-arginine translocase TatA/TatE family subunit [Rubrivivax sp.]|nr:twin-arginine translocase TatA/TatE family subunit [Pyrinomonadaceae bacterium]